MKSKKLFATLFCLISTSVLAQPQFTSFVTHTKKDGNIVTSPLRTACQINFSRPDINICIDSADGNNYPLSAQLSCHINPVAKNVPVWMKNYCNGELQDYDPGVSDYVEVQVLDKNNPPKMIIDQIHVKMGICAADFKNTNLPDLAGNIYSCDQATGKFKIAKISG